LVIDLFNFITYSRGSICFAHIRFRKAWKVQGHSLDDLPFKAAAGVWGSWIGLIIVILCLIAQFYIALFPIGATPNAQAFFEAYLAAPIIFAMYVIWKVVNKTRFVRASEVDLVSGRRDMNLHELREQDLRDQAHWNPFQRYCAFFIRLTIRVYYWMC
jgi:yeast amino acid transporter